MKSMVIRAIPLGRLRLAEVEDAAKVAGLLTQSMSINFRVKEPTDIVTLIENSVLSICQLDIHDTVVGFLAVKDYPLVPALSPAGWESFVWNKYKAIDMNARNTLFVHLLCWESTYARDVVDNMLKSLFMHDPYLNYVGMMKSIIDSPLLYPGKGRAEVSFKRIQALERSTPGDKLPSLWVADRKEVSPRLRIRRAVEEDNDDIVPIIERQSTRLRELYGDFYVSELISRHPESERVLLVCEHKEVAVGVMCLNTQINYEGLEESYELTAFCGLRKGHCSQVQYKLMDSATSFPGLCLTESLYSTNVDGIGVMLQESKTKVTWGFEEDMFKQDHNDESLYQASVSSSQNDILSLLEYDEDELEYDIVNIDTDLLRLPALYWSEDKTKGLNEEKKVLNEEKHLDIKHKKKKRSSGLSVSKLPELSRFSGQPNAFLLELFAMHQDYDERYGFDMLEAAFELFPNRDYCIMSLPSSQSCFPLLEHFTLVTPLSCRWKFIRESLFVAHVNSVKGNVGVRPGEMIDSNSLMDILEHSPRKVDLIKLFHKSLLTSTLSSFVLLSENQPVGVVLLSPLENATTIRNEYALEPEMRQPGGDAAILAGVLSPVLEPHARWYLRELIRQTNYLSLFWTCRLFTKGDASPHKNLMSLAGHMLPVRPRRFLPNAINRELEKIFKDVATPFALWSIEAPITSLPKVPINTSIVVVGASRTGLAFLETLFLGPSSAYLTFTNVTLVSENGLPASEGLRVGETCLPRSGRYSERYLKSLPFYFYIDVVIGLMVKIDREKKCIHLQGGSLKFYDDLVLTCGRQFQHPYYLKESLELAKEIQKGKPCERILMDNPQYRPDAVPQRPQPFENVMMINSHSDANMYIAILLDSIIEAKDSANCLARENPVVVYGDCVEAYCCIAALLEQGIEAQNILFVEPFPAQEDSSIRVNCFNNETVDIRVQAKLADLGITVYRECHLDDMYATSNRVETLALMSPSQLLLVPCFALFYFGLKAINLHTFKAIIRCGLVYDDGLIVNTMFESNDPYVYAAGSCTRYSRQLLSRVYHRDYCSEDVGEALGNLFLNRLDPFLTGSNYTENDSMSLPNYYSTSMLGLKGSHGSFQSTSRISINQTRSRWQPVLKFESPIVLSATLPGPLHYLTVRRPGLDIPMAVRLLLPHQGHSLVTNKRGNYFHLQLNALHRVESICCLSNKTYPHDAFAQLYGHHEAMFNRLLYRFENNLIDDLYSYFTKPWISALYQEPICNLLADIDEQAGEKVYDFVKSKMSEFYEGPKILCSCIHSKNAQQPHKKAMDIPSECGQDEGVRHDASVFWKTIDGENIVIKNLTKFLLNNNICNPHYAVPDPKIVFNS